MTKRKMSHLLYHLYTTILFFSLVQYLELYAAFSLKLFKHASSTKSHYNSLINARQVSSSKFKGDFRRLFASESDNYDDSKNLNSNKSSKFSRMVDDFIGKRFGAGEAFYGKRMSDLSEEEFETLEKSSRSSSKFENIPFKDNAVLLVGDVHLGVAEWIVYDLHEKGFNIRLATSNKAKAVSVFGLSGNNVDIIELSSDCSESLLATAIQGVQAIIFCGNFDPKMSFFLDSCRKENIIALRILEVVRKAVIANVSTIRKIAHVSRFSSLNDEDNSAILFPPQSLLNNPILYNDFKYLHYELEVAVQRTGIEYIIVRCPSVVLRSRAGSFFQLMIFDKNGAAVSQKVTTDLKSLTTSQKIGILDLAEATVQALILDVSNKIFTIAEASDFSSDSLESTSELKRVARSAYYNILEMDDQEMRNSYVMKPVEVYESQLLEDEAAEKYWRNLFRNL